MSEKCRRTAKDKIVEENDSDCSQKSKKINKSLRNTNSEKNNKNSDKEKDKMEVKRKRNLEKLQADLDFINKP